LFNQTVGLSYAETGSAAASTSFKRRSSSTEQGLSPLTNH